MIVPLPILTCGRGPITMFADGSVHRRRSTGRSACATKAGVVKSTEAGRTDVGGGGAEGDLHFSGRNSQLTKRGPTTRRASSWLPDDFEAKISHCEVRDKASMFKGFGVEAL